MTTSRLQFIFMVSFIYNSIKFQQNEMLQKILSEYRTGDKKKGSPSASSFNTEQPYHDQSEASHDRKIISYIANFFKIIWKLQPGGSLKVRQICQISDNRLKMRQHKQA